VTLADREVLAGLARLLDGEIAEAEPVGWGDAAATWRLTLVDGRRFAARRLAGDGADRRAERMTRVFAALRRSRLPTPDHVARWSPHPGVAWVVTTWVDGAIGAGWLDDPGRASRLATAMGGLLDRVATVDLADLAIDMTWADGDALSAGSARWVATLEGRLDDPLRRSIDQAIRSATTAADGADWAPGFAHGDFAPVNVILDADGTPVALLDVEDARVAPRAYDVAWWGWIVRYHHPTAWPAAWPAFLDAAGLPSPTPLTDATLHAIQVLQTLERAAGTADPLAQGRWITRASAIASWRP
jgi:aminoglycoside phosphotransferase (APT) family kinase protein